MWRFISGFALALVALQAASKSPDQRPLARIVAIEGGVLVSREFEISSAKGGEALFTGARVLVTQNSRALVEYFGGCRIELGAGARFDVAAEEACADLVRADWGPNPTHPPLAPYHFEIPVADVQRVCRGTPASPAYGCVIRVHDTDLCLVYTHPKPPRWLLEHELRHCAGWDHGPHGDGAMQLAAPPPARHPSLDP